jgi:hypothetical protein
MNEIKTLKWMYIQLLTLTSYFEVYVSRPTSYVRTPFRRPHQGISSLRGTHPSCSARVAPRSSLLWRALTSQSSTSQCSWYSCLSHWWARQVRPVRRTAHPAASCSQSPAFYDLRLSHFVKFDKTGPQSWLWHWLSTLTVSISLV